MYSLKDMNLNDRVNYLVNCRLFVFQRTRPMVEDITSDHQQRTVISLPSQSNFQITLSQLSTAEVCSSCQPAACSLPQPTREVCTEHRSTKIVQTQCLHTDAHRSAVLDRVVYSSDSATQTESIKPESDEENCGF